jgi:hypothetical protein
VTGERDARVFLASLSFSFWDEEEDMEGGVVEEDFDDDAAVGCAAGGA